MIDIAANRSARNYPLRLQLARVLWACAYPLFRVSPRPLWAWRRWMLRCFGAHVEGDVHIHPSVRIAMPWNLTLRSQCAVGDRAILYALGCIEVGARATVSQGAHLCAGTHDHRRADRPLLTPPIQVGADSWIAADAFYWPRSLCRSTVHCRRAGRCDEIGL